MIKIIEVKEILLQKEIYLLVKETTPMSLKQKLVISLVNQIMEINCFKDLLVINKRINH